MDIREGRLVDGSPSRIRTTLLGYLSLTKPRVIELLLVTTIPAMLLAHRGTVDPLLILNTLVGGLLAAAGANTLNCVADADIDKMMKRTGVGRWPGPLCRAAMRWFRAGVVGRLVLLAVVDDEHAVRAPGRRDHRVLCARLHAAAQAPDVAERGVGRGGRLHAGDDRLVGGDGHHRVARAGDVRDHLLLDAAAHLGAGDALQGRLPAAGVPMLPAVATERQVTKQILIYTWLTVAATLALALATGWLYASVAWWRAPGSWRWPINCTPGCAAASPSSHCGCSCSRTTISPSCSARSPSTRRWPSDSVEPLAQTTVAGGSSTAITEIVSSSMFVT